MGAIAILAAPLYVILTPLVLGESFFGNAFNTISEIFSLWTNFFS